jgi:hypothetical protein
MVRTPFAGALDFFDFGLRATPVFNLISAVGLESNYATTAQLEESLFSLCI